MPEIREDTIKRLNKGDTKSFELLYSTYYVYLCAVATKYIFNSETAREIVNDVFLSEDVSKLRHISFFILK